MYIIRTCLSNCKETGHLWSSSSADNAFGDISVITYRCTMGDVFLVADDKMKILTLVPIVSSLLLFLIDCNTVVFLFIIFIIIIIYYWDCYCCVVTLLLLDTKIQKEHPYLYFGILLV